MLGDLATWVQDVVVQFGYIGVMLLVIVENVFPPIPSEIILPFAGFVTQPSSTAVASNNFSLIGMIIAATIGSTIGAVLLYSIAATIGPVRLSRFVERFGRWFGVKPKDLAKAEAWFDSRSNVAVFVGRCVPLVRSIVSIPAGFRKMKLSKFIVLSASGSAVWNVALIGSGAILGDQWTAVQDYVGIFQWIVILAIFVIVVRFLFWRTRSGWIN